MEGSVGLEFLKSWTAPAILAVLLIAVWCKLWEAWCLYKGYRPASNRSVMVLKGSHKQRGQSPF